MATVDCLDYMTSPDYNGVPDARRTAIKAFRKEGKLSQQELADTLGVSRATVNRWEMGWSKMTARKLPGRAIMFLFQLGAYIDNGTYPTPFLKSEDGKAEVDWSVMLETVE